MGDGGLESAQLTQRAGKAIMRERPIGFQRDRAAIATDRLLAFAREAQCVAKVDMRFGDPAESGESPADQLSAAFSLSESGFDDAKQARNTGMPRRRIEQLGVERFSLSEPSRLMVL
jgi:hypothetical protein